MDHEQAIHSEFLSLELPLNRTLVEYIWIGGTGQDLRSKTRTLDYVPAGPDNVPEWNYDGSSTKQAPGINTEVILRAKALFKDPFRRGQHILAVCDTYSPEGTPIPSNTRHPASLTIDRVRDQEPWIGLEQEYTLYTLENSPLGWPQGGFPAPQGPYYCGIGADKAFGRSIVEAHYRACLYAGINIGGVNAEVMPGQWEFQVGPCTGLDAADQLWAARYILHRICERFGVVASFHPKPVVEGDWNGAGCHTNFSTKATRADGGYEVIKQHMDKLRAKHDAHILVYGEHNTLRLTGRHETAPITEFKWGVADRKASIRVPSCVAKEGKGYYEDRRPASNIDPYLVINRIVLTTCLDE